MHEIDNSYQLSDKKYMALQVRAQLFLSLRLILLHALKQRYSMDLYNVVIFMILVKMVGKYFVILFC